MTRPDTLCPQCDTSHKGDRKTWPLQEAARKYVAEHGIPSSVVGPVPAKIGWSLYARKESQRAQRHEGSWDDYQDFVARLANEVLQGIDDKLEKPFISSVAFGDGRSTDQNAEAIHVLWFDVDSGKNNEDVTHKTWDHLIARLRELGLGAIITESSSRKPGNWHLGLVLVSPILFQKPKIDRRAIDFKLRYRNVAAGLSALAGFLGVGGKCGMDLAIDRLTQPVFPVTRASIDEAPGKVIRIPGGALDFDAFVEATGFDLQAARALDTREHLRKAPAGPRTPRGPGRLVNTTDSRIGGPIGAGLEADGALRNWTDLNGVQAACPNFASHTGGRGQWSALYFPKNDHFWCCHTTCKVNPPDVPASFSPRARAIYDKLRGEQHRAARTPWAAENKHETPSAIVAWWNSLDPELNEGASGSDLKAALTWFLVINKISGHRTKQVLRQIEKLATADARVERAVLRFKAKGAKGTGGKRIRKGVGARNAWGLAQAYAMDMGVELCVAWRLIGGLGTITNKGWLRDLHGGLAFRDKFLASAVLRPTGCYQFTDTVYADGLEAATFNMFCESRSCALCSNIRMMTLARALDEGWTSAKTGEREEGWKNRGPFWIHTATVDTLAELEELLLEIRSGIKCSKIRLLTFDDADRPTVVLITDDRSDNNSIYAVLGNLPGISYSRRKTDDYKDAIGEVVKAHVGGLVHAQSLVEAENEEGYISFLEWSRGKHFLSSGRRVGCLPIPNRADLRLASKSEDEDDYDLIAGAENVEYVARHRNSGCVISTSRYPHMLYGVLIKSASNTMFQHQMAAAARSGDDHPAELEIEARLQEQERARPRARAPA